MGKKKKQLDPRCSVDDCPKRLTPAFKAQCPKCGEWTVCKDHVYDHKCDASSGGLEKSGGPGTVIGSSAGIVVVGKTGSSTNGNGNGGPAKTASKKKDEVNVEEFLGKLAKQAESKRKKLGVEFLEYMQGKAALDAEPLLVKALASDEKKLRDVMYSGVGKTILEEMNKAEELWEVFGKRLDKVSSQPKLRSSEERLLTSMATMMGVLIGFNSGALCTEARISKLIEYCSSANDKLAKGAASGLRRALKVCASLENMKESLKNLLESLTQQVLEGCEDPSEQTGKATAFSAVLSTLGPLTSYSDVENKINALVERVETPQKRKASNSKDKKKIATEGHVMTCLKALEMLLRDVGTRVVPYCVNHERSNIIERLGLEYYGKAPAEARTATKKVLTQLMKKLDPCAVRIVVPILLEKGFKNQSSWRVQALSLNFLGQLAGRDAPGLSLLLPDIVPQIMEGVGDSKKEVSQAASSALDELSSVIRNPETMKLMPYLLKALNDANFVEQCLDELMDMTFVNSIDSQSLALIVPVVLRGMREGSAEVKLKGSIAMGNVCSIVADVNDIRPFVPQVLPELHKLTNHSTPRVRQLAQEAKVSLLAGVGLDVDQASKVNDFQIPVVPEQLMKSTAQDVEMCLDRFYGESENESKTVDGTIRRHVVLAATYELENMYEILDPQLPSSLAKKAIRKRVKAAVDDFIENQLAESVGDIIFEGWLRANNRFANRRRGSSAVDNSEQDFLLYIPSIILAFASKVLLRRTTLKMARGHRYALVGQNGVGKTTLLNRIAAKDINGFPSDVTVYYVRHEIMDEDADLTVLGFMQRVVKETAQPDMAKAMESRIQDALLEVGFKDQEMQEKPVANLSGGWRMRLAIARSMLYNADLLLLDEPTNHLDEAAIEWLQTYLTNLTDATIGVVSHDYDFLTVVATDIIHIHDLKLSYYEGGFKAFQELCPEIVAALPRVEKKPIGNIPHSSSVESMQSAATSTSSGSSTLQENEELSALEILALDPSDERFQNLVRTMKPIKFPSGGKLDGISSRGKTVASLTNVTFAYPGTDRIILDNVSVRLNLNSRVAIVGPNGAGKSTLLKILIGIEEVKVSESEGNNDSRVWRHHNLRISYIAQSSLFHLEEHFELTPCQYIQLRFYEGQDREHKKIMTLSLTDEEKEIMEQRGEVCEVLSRVTRGKKLYYEIKKTGRKMKGEDNTEFRSLEELERMGKPHAVKLARMFDEKLKASASGMDIRPLTTPEMVKHLADFGIAEEQALRKIRWLSGGQKCRLVLAAAMWIKPHMIVLDEPTNFLDNNTLAALTYALKTFRGGVLFISHHSGFVKALAKEIWHLENGHIAISSLNTDP